MHAERQIEAQLSLAVRPRRAAMLFAVAACVAAVFGWHWPTFASMANTWWRTETFAHGLLVLPIFAWLVWRDRARLDAVPFKPYAPALLPLALAGFVWMLGELSATLSVSQFAMVAMVPCAVCAVLGLRAARALAFPLVFLFFAVPFGGFMLPWLMEWTADFTVSAVRLSGVPVYREGMMFVIPSGAWSVVEACSGLRYLIASVMVGTLYAYLTYRSLKRRLLFVGVSMVVPLVANWLRAYLIVMLGHLSDNRLAAGVDHLIYGWIFFGVVMAIMFWIGTRWREDLAETPARPAPAVAAIPAKLLPRTTWAVAAAALLAAGMWRPLAYALDMPDANAVTLQPLAGVAGWQTADADALPLWRPALDRPAASVEQAFAKDGAVVGLRIAYYRNQSQQSEAVGGNEANAEEGWRLLRTGSVTLPFDRVSALRNEYLHPRERVVAWRWYWIDGHMTANAYMAKARLAWSKLARRGDDSAAIVVYTHAAEDAEADRRLADFVGAIAPQLRSQLERTRRSAR